MATLSQSYSYVDPANRLSLASETGGWTQNYNYDAFGNRAVAAGSYMPNEGFTPSGTVASVFPRSDNRLVRGAGDAYDGAGNQTAWATVPASASGSWFTYDGENRLLAANVAGDCSHAGGASFVYDGEGRRVQKISSSGAVTTYVHDAMGNLAAEYSTAAPAAAGTQYLTSDFLGSTRLITDASGNPVRCFDYLPFGEEIPAGMNGRTGCYETMGSPQYPSPPDVADQKFTGKERDAETGLDFFGARYYSSAMGRFMSPDWSAKAEPVPYAKLDNPQSLNLYAYSLNNPLRNVDRDGHCDSSACATANTRCQDTKALHANDPGLNHIKKAEGVPGSGGKPQLEVKPDTAGHPTVGFGHKVTEVDNLQVGDKIDASKADSLFKADVNTAESAVKNAAGNLPLSQGEFNALTDLVFNVGSVP